MRSRRRDVLLSNAPSQVSAEDMPDAVVSRHFYENYAFVKEVWFRAEND